jgi:hypothetical protein
MRLSDLNPKWVTLAGWASQAPFYVGLSFDCPCHRCRHDACPTCGHAPRPKRLSVSFWPPVDPQNVAATFMSPVPDNGGHRRQGETFDDLTLSPSVGFDAIGHWHGHITAGNVTGA